jgi:hypothetical protein
MHAERRVRIGQWARLLVHLPDDARVERLFRGSTTAAGADVTWELVVRQAASLRARRERTLVRAR